MVNWWVWSYFRHKRKILFGASTANINFGFLLLFFCIKPIKGTLACVATCFIFLDKKDVVIYCCVLDCYFIVVVARAAEDGEIDIDIVHCPDQQEACKCRKKAEACQFRLDIEELQTFTSYKINEDGDIITRGTPGDTYFITQNGLVASIIDPNNAKIPELGPYWNNSTLSSETDFNNMGCSFPMMVDGRSYRQFVAVNGRIPGPTLIVYKDQYVVIDVFNHLTNEGITIHWHGTHHGWMELQPRGWQRPQKAYEISKS